jgi:hypothetical protein
MKEKIRVESDSTTIRIYIQDLPHLCFKTALYKGFHSWIEGDNNSKYVIEFYFNNSESIKTEYFNKNLWIEILSGLDKTM